MRARNFPVPLSEELYSLLHEEAARQGRPGTQVVREILEQQLKSLRADALHREIVAYAQAAGGGEPDSQIPDGSADLWALLKDDHW